MGLIGITEAAARAGMTVDGVRAALQNAEIELVRISPRAFAVDEAELEAFIAKRGKNPGRGRPPGAKNKRKEGR